MQTRKTKLESKQYEFRFRTRLFLSDQLENVFTLAKLELRVIPQNIVGFNHITSVTQGSVLGVEWL